MGGHVQIEPPLKVTHLTIHKCDTFLDSAVTLIGVKKIIQEDKGLIKW